MGGQTQMTDGQNPINLGRTGIWSWDVTREIFYGDAIFARYDGLTEEEAAAGVSVNRVFAAVHPDDRLEMERALTESLQNRSTPTFKFRARGSDGTWRRLIAAGHCFYDGDDRPRNYAGFVIQLDLLKKHVREKVMEALDKLADSSMEARRHSAAVGLDFITYLLDMVLMEVGFALAEREKKVLESKATKEIPNIHRRRLRRPV